jgi:hypothetical protein
VILEVVKKLPRIRLTFQDGRSCEIVPVWYHLRIAYLSETGSDKLSAAKYN